VVRIWRHFFAQAHSSVHNALVDALNAEGLESEKLNDTNSSDPGIVFFDRVSPELYTFLADVSCNSRHRVLGVAFASSGLRDDQAWRVLGAGASDVLVWDERKNTAAAIFARFERWKIVDRLVNSPAVRDKLVGNSGVWLSALRKVVEVARFTDAPVLIMGESGTGKELFARTIHALDSRPNKPALVVVDCTTIVPELSGSEFFGHERGAFTGAIASRDGAFGLSNGGTLFLDEIGELPPAMQAQLLRAIQEHTYKRVGSDTWRQTDFRLVCATNRDLCAEVAAGRFRADLFYRIASVICSTPNLEARTEDILPLARHFIQEIEPHSESPDFDAPVQHYLLRRHYPGNVRELKQVITRIVYRHVGPGAITVGDLPEEERLAPGSDPNSWRDQAFEQAVRRVLCLGIGLKEIGRAAKEIAEQVAIEEEGGNVHRAALRLRISDRALQLRRAARRERHSIE
jgi:transcriptional regulator with GAF, ATPase, and Fis domain